MYLFHADKKNPCLIDLIVRVNILFFLSLFLSFFSRLKGLPSTKLHTLLLDHNEVKLTWYIDWAKRDVLFNVDEAFTPETDWFLFGFSKRGQTERSDVCFFVRSFYDEVYNEAIVWQLIEKF